MPGSERNVQFLVHLEIGESGDLLWWAEAPDLPGFSALAPSLLDLNHEARAGLEWLLEERGEHLGSVTLDLVETEPATSNPSRASGEGDIVSEAPDAPGSKARVAIAA